MNTPQKNRLSWLIVALVGWYSIGVFLFPAWWSKFVFKFGFISLSNYSYGFSRIFHFIFFESSFFAVLLSLALVLLIFPSARSLCRLPEINIFTPLKSITICAFLFVSTMHIYNFDNSTTIPPTSKSDNLPNKEESNPSFFAQIKIIDPIYTNDEKIDLLYAQISPGKTLTKSTTEETSEKNQSGEAGVEHVVTIEGKMEVKTGGKVTKEFLHNEEQLPSKILKVLNYLDATKQLHSYDRLEFSSNEIKKLESFAKTAAEFNIRIDENSYTQAFMNTTKDAFLKQKQFLYENNPLMLLHGEHCISTDRGKIVIVKEYFSLNGKLTINFVYEQLPPEQIKSKSILATYQAGGTSKVKLDSLARIISVDEKDGNITVHCEPYAIFWTQ